MDEFDPVPRVSPMFKGFAFAFWILFVGLAAWGLVAGLGLIVWWLA